MVQEQAMALPGRVFQAVVGASRATAGSFDQRAQRRHAVLMKHGHPPETNTVPALIRAGAAVACAAVLGLSVVAIAAMVVY